MAGQLVQFRLTDNEYDQLVNLTPQGLSVSRQAKRTLLEWMDKQVISTGNQVQMVAGNQEVISNDGTQPINPSSEVISKGNQPMIRDNAAEVISTGNQQVISKTGRDREATFCKIGDRVEWRHMRKGKCESVHRATIISIANGLAATDTRQTISPKEWLKSWFPVTSPDSTKANTADSRIPTGDTQVLIYDDKDRRQGATYAFGSGVLFPRDLTSNADSEEIARLRIDADRCNAALSQQIAINQRCVDSRLKLEAEKLELESNLEACLRREGEQQAVAQAYLSRAINAESRQTKDKQQALNALLAYDSECDRLTREKLAALEIGHFTADAVSTLEAGLEKLTDISVDALQRKNIELAAVEAEKQRATQLAVLAATSNQELREKLATEKNARLTATATATALEKQLEFANKENEQLRDRVEQLATALSGTSLLSLPQLQAKLEEYLASLKGSETSIKTYGYTLKKYLGFLAQSLAQA